MRSPPRQPAPAEPAVEAAPGCAGDRVARDRGAEHDRGDRSGRRQCAVARQASQSESELALGITRQRCSEPRSAGTARSGSRRDRGTVGRPDAQARGPSRSRGRAARHGGDHLAPPSPSRSHRPRSGSRSPSAGTCYASARHKVHWSLVLGVLRARGERGSVPLPSEGSTGSRRTSRGSAPARTSGTPPWRSRAARPSTGRSHSPATTAQSASRPSSAVSGGRGRCSRSGC